MSNHASSGSGSGNDNGSDSNNDNGTGSNNDNGNDGRDHGASDRDASAVATVATVATADLAAANAPGPSPLEDPSRWDCQACGACCRNLDSNLASGVRYWVEIAPGDRILTRQDLVRKLVTHDRNRVPHLRMTHEGSCEALRGTLGKKVTCSIYHQRPSPCRRVMPGDDTCLRSRAALGIA